MMTQAEMNELATKYAYDIITCPGSPDVQTAIELWQDDNIGVEEGVSVWEPFERYEACELLGLLRDFEDAFLNFVKEILDK